MELEIAGVKPEDAKRLLNVRTYLQYRQMVDCFLRGFCIFCQLDPKINTVVAIEGGWRAWKNAYEPKNLSAAIVLAPIGHISEPTEMTRADWVDQGKLIQNLLKGGRYRGGIVSTRFGDPQFSSGSVEHLHTQIMVPNGSGEVMVPVRKSKEKLLINYQTALVFEKIRKGTLLEDLTPQERELINGKI